MKSDASLRQQIQLPNAWQLVKLRDVIEEALPGFAEGKRDAEGIIQLRMNNVNTRGYLILSEYIRVPVAQNSVMKYQLLPGDVVFNNTNSTELVGKSAVFTGYSETIVYSNHFTRLRTRNKQLYPNFLAAWLLHQWQNKVFQNLCNRWIGQSAVKNDKLLELTMPLPPLDEQKRIVSGLNEQMVAIEKARLAAEAQLTASNALPDSYLRAAFDSSSARAWPKCRLGDICEVVAKQVDPRVHEYGQLPHVNGENIESGTGRITYLKTAIELGMISGKYLFEPGDVLYSKLRPYLRKVTIVDYRGVCSADMYPIRFDRTIMEPQFAAWMLISDSFTKYADEQSRRARMPKLNRDQLFSYKASVPPLDEQREIISRLDKLFSASKKLNELLSAELVTITILPAVLLGRAFTGGI